jgi:hypothetical protein
MIFLQQIVLYGFEHIYMASTYYSRSSKQERRQRWDKFLDSTRISNLIN